ncbi:retroelement silencing factor 1 isoform X3 [Colius striatus]|uniref:retroelement silencing factor 1 isoform X3 n=1 Tax=Colius striatus TaxID=57412 RepID=UPI002B1D9CE7|nr:retroelement silencing factor 1 isoform X3 [Colius striatus]XP_061866433.1 retroelement silencing factor 1 isoform X3 [Colius striatus]XP_061866437.1 retroelement silencing factor 1 isoform X3 [Colius striatus]
MDWNGRPFQNADANKNMQSAETRYPQLLSTAQGFPQTNACSSKNACTYAGNNQMLYLPTSNVTFPLVNAEGFRTSDQVLPGASVAGKDFRISKYSVDQHPSSWAPIGPKLPNQTSRLRAEMTQTSWPDSNAPIYRTLPSVSSQMNSGSNMKNVVWESQYVTTNSYTVHPQIPHQNSMRTTMLYQSNTNSQNNPIIGIPGQHVQNQICHSNTQFKVSHSLNQNTEANVQIVHYRASQMGSEAPGNCSAQSLMLANCDSRNAAQSSVVAPQAGQNVPNGYIISQRRHPSDMKNASGFNSVQQHYQKLQPGEVNHSLGNVYNSNGNVTANQSLNAMSVPPPDISKELDDVIQELETLSSVTASKTLSNPASVQESQTTSLMNRPVNSQVSSLVVEKMKRARDRLAWEAQNLLTIKKKCVLLEKLHHYKRKLLAASEHNNLRVPPSYQEAFANRLSWVPNPNVPLSPSKTLRIENPVRSSSPEERNANDVANADNRELEITQSNLQVEQRSLSLSSASSSSSTPSFCSAPSLNSASSSSAPSSSSVPLSSSPLLSSDPSSSFTSSSNFTPSLSSAPPSSFTPSLSSAPLSSFGPSSSSAPPPSQSKLPAQLNSLESTPSSEQKDTCALTSSQKDVTSLNKGSCFSLVDGGVKIASKDVPGNSSFLQFVLSSANVLKEKTAGATADKILTGLLCSEKPMIDTTVSDKSSLKDTSEKKTESKKGEQPFMVHTNSPVSEATESGGANFQGDVAQKKTLLTEKTSSKQNNGSYTMEELTACLGLWRNSGPSETISVQNSQLNGSSTANQISSYSQTTKNGEQNNVPVSTVGEILPVTSASPGQKLDTMSCNLLKSFELQVAVVTPLVLLEQRTQNQQIDKCPASVGKMTAVTDSRSTCSLQEAGKNELGVVNTDKATIASPSNCVLAQKVDTNLQQTKLADENGIIKNSANANDLYGENQSKVSKPAQDARENPQNKPSFPELGINPSSEIFQEVARDHKDRQAVLETGYTSTAVLEDQMFCITSVCSLVEGDTSYNPQIASIFKPVPELDALNGTMSEGNASDPEQKEQQQVFSRNKLSSNTPQRDSLLLKILDTSSNCKSKAGNNLDCSTTSNLKKQSSGGPPNTVSASKQNRPLIASFKHPKTYLKGPTHTRQELALNSPISSSSLTAETAGVNSEQNYVCCKNSTEKEENFFGARPIKYLNNQLYELVKEFPYGIEGADILTKEPVQNNSVAERMENQPQKETQICDKNSHLNDPVDQIKIEVLSSDQVQELFPEHSQCSSNEKKSVGSQQSEKASAEENHEGNIQPSQSLFEKKKNTQDPSSPTVKKTDDCSLMSSPSVACEMPPWKSEMSVSEKNDDQLSKFKNTSSTETLDNNSEIDAVMENCAVGNLPNSEKTPNSDSENNICKNTSPVDKKPSLKVNNEHKLLTRQQEKYEPLNSSENQDVDKTRKNSWKEETQINRGSPLLDKEFHSDKKEHQTATEELSERAGHTDAADTTNSSKKKKRLFKRESLSKDKTKTGLAMKFQGVRKSETVEGKHDKVNQGQKNETCKENSAEEQICRKQKEIPRQDVGVHIKDKGKLSAEIKHTKLNSYRDDAVKFPNVATVDLKARNHKYPQHKCIKVHPSQEQPYKRKRKETMIGKRDPKKSKVEEESLKQSEAKNSQQLPHNCVINTDKAKKLNGENGWKPRTSLADHAVLKLQRKRGRPSTISKNYFSNRDKHLEGQNKDKGSERMFSDKNMLYFNRRNNRLKFHLQKEPKKHYLNRVAFKRMAQERIYLTKLETSPVRPICHRKSKVSQNSPDAKRRASASEVEKSCEPQALEFKLYPEMLLRNPATDEENLAAKNSSEREKAIVAGVKSKKEDWLKSDPVKQKKLEEIFTGMSEQAVDHHKFKEEDYYALKEQCTSL